VTNFVEKWGEPTPPPPTSKMLKNTKDRITKTYHNYTKNTYRRHLLSLTEAAHDDSKDDYDDDYDDNRYNKYHYIKITKISWHWSHLWWRKGRLHDSITK
jgi:hypothetical protein